MGFFFRANDGRLSPPINREALNENLNFNIGVGMLSNFAPLDSLYSSTLMSPQTLSLNIKPRIMQPKLDVCRGTVRTEPVRKQRYEVKKEA